MIFGKLPAHGDFICRGMTADQQTEFDTALSGSVQAAQQRFGEGYRDGFLSAPPWRCVIAAGGSYLGGALAPSMDRAERLFPIFLARQSTSPGEAAAGARACEDLLFRAIPEMWPVDRLMAEAEALPGACDGDAEAATEPGEGWWLDGGETLPSPTPHLSGTVPVSLIEEMIAVTGQLA
ncbi:type VI secretion system-associated protein TagF [Novosphingobium sp.]|uniref:type VI secretion system-associated protein TagF n=1 Tax=Novosphingobium sp. TaxID=1874826 RepID=UPI00286E5F3B|nr:type VI secretion system-associated protein TagF [Novosphingobium sp.]